DLSTLLSLMRWSFVCFVIGSIDRGLLIYGLFEIFQEDRMREQLQEIFLNQKSEFSNLATDIAREMRVPISQLNLIIDQNEVSEQVSDTSITEAIQNLSKIVEELLKIGKRQIQIENENQRLLNLSENSR